MYLAGYAICITSSGFSERPCRWRKTRNTFLFLLFLFPDKRKLRKLVATALQERLRESDRLKGKDAGQFSPKHVSVTDFFLTYVNICVCVHVCTCVWDPAEARWGCHNTLELGLQVVVSYLTPALGIKLGSLKEQEWLTTEHLSGPAVSI